MFSKYLCTRGQRLRAEIIFLSLCVFSSQTLLELLTESPWFEVSLLLPCLYFQISALCHCLIMFAFSCGSCVKLLLVKNPTFPDLLLHKKKPLDNKIAGGL